MEKITPETPLLVLAGNWNRYAVWKREKHDQYVGYGFLPRYLPASNLNFVGKKDCFFIRGNDWETGGYKEEMFRYFDSHNIQEII